MAEETSLPSLKQDLLALYDATNDRLADFLTDCGQEDEDDLDLDIQDLCTYYNYTGVLDGIRQSIQLVSLYQEAS